jgi:hypothetical protein
LISALKETSFEDDKFTLRLQRRNILNYHFFGYGPELIWNDNSRFVIPCFYPRQSTAYSCILMFIALSFIKRIVTLMKRNIQHRRTCRTSMSKIVWSELRTEARTIFLNTSFYIQEDRAPWNSRLRTAQVRFLFLQCCYLQTVLISVFTVFGTFA